MDNSFLNTLALEYLKSKYNINSLEVDEFYKKYCEIYDQLLKLNDERTKNIGKDSLNAWLKG